MINHTIVSYIGFINFDGILERRKKGRKQHLIIYQDGEKKENLFFNPSFHSIERERDNHTPKYINKYKE